MTTLRQFSYSISFFHGLFFLLRVSCRFTAVIPLPAVLSQDEAFGARFESFELFAPVLLQAIVQILLHYSIISVSSILVPMDYQKSCVVTNMKEGTNLPATTRRNGRQT